MNPIREKLMIEIMNKEKEMEKATNKDSNRLKFHLMPKVGWLNDPNGLCYFQGNYHIFYQYSPLDVNGGLKVWGHDTSPDFVHWKKESVALYPDQSFDKDGVYSGSALVWKDKMYLCYTGNVKQEGSHDYVLSGREANTVLVETKDGVHFSEKELLMTNFDYPKEYTCHIRDPKLWSENNLFYMVQGGRRKAVGKDAGKEWADQGAVLLFQSSDLRKWSFVKEITTTKRFGYMWECPDYFCLDGQHILSISPQGLEKEEYQYQNQYQSGYFRLEESIIETKEIRSMESFEEWDKGFDFYAPQTFEDENGRRILIGWAGVPDAEYDNMPTIENGWQFSLTVPRELTINNGKVLQNPVTEMELLRRTGKIISENKEVVSPSVSFELVMEKEKKEANCSISIKCLGEEVTLAYEKGIVSLTLTEKAGRGRKLRKAKIEGITNIRMLVDTSMLEVFLNNGSMVFTTRFYFEEEERVINMNGWNKVTLWELNRMEGEIE